MANHKSSVKRTRQDKVKREHNRYYKKTTRNAIKELVESKDKKTAEAAFPKVVAMVDKLAKNNLIHKKNADNTKSRLSKAINKMS